jgi:hypothetical protein
MKDPGQAGVCRIVRPVKLPARRVFVVAVAAVAVIAAAGTALAVGVPSNPAPGIRSNVVSVAADGHGDAALEVTAGTPVLSVTVANLGGTNGTLLRASTPDGAPRPDVRVAGGGATGRSAGNEFVSVAASDGSSPVTITLNAAVTWLLDFAGGTQRTVADLRGGRLAGIVVSAGSDVIDLTLPRPTAMVPVQFAGGASQFLLSLPSGVPVRVTAAGGAGEVSLDGQEHTGVGGGSVFATPGWAAGTAGFDVDATAGVSRVAVTRWTAPSRPAGS